MTSCLGRAAAIAAAWAIAGSPAPARAELRDDEARLADAWRRGGQTVEALPSVFVERGHPRLVSVLSKSGGPAKIDAGNGCVTIAVIGARTADFHVDVERAPADPREDRQRTDDSDARARSSSGVATLSRCGADRAALARIVVDVNAGRAAVEVLVAHGDKEAESPADVLPDRVVGPVAPRGDAGGPIEPGPLAARIARALARAKSDGASKVTKSRMVSSEGGSGRFDLKLAEGCHRIEVLADVPQRVPRRATDIDAEAREADGGRTLARDRADVPDARLDFCLGEPTAVEIPFVGGADAVEVALTDAQFALPARIPDRFGARARGGLAWALHRRHAPAPRDAPTTIALGAQGVTELTIPVEPGRCYLAAAAIRRGDARSLHLAVDVQDQRSHDDVENHAEAAAVAFCSDTDARAHATVEVRGASVSWLLVVWPMGDPPS